MKPMKRLRTAAIILGVVLAAALLAYTGTDREPACHKILLSEWLRRAQTTADKYRDPKEADADPVLIDCKAAIHEMGAKAVPFLLDDLQRQNSTLKARVVAWSRRPGVARVLPARIVTWLQDLMLRDLIDTALGHRRAIWAFNVLGPQAASADPVLLKLTSDTNSEKRFWALAALAGTRPPKEVFMPAATRQLTDPDSSLQVAAAIRIIELYPAEAEALNLYQTFPHLLYLRAKAVASPASGLRRP
jgi:hypothetical protein